MNPVSEDIMSMLVDESALGLAIGTNLFMGLEPNEPDNCVTIFDTSGYDPQLTLDRKNYFYPSIQIRVRNNEYKAGWSLIYDIMVSLHGRGQEVWNETLYSVIKAIGDIAFMDWDEKDRARFIINFDMQRRED